MHKNTKKWSKNLVDIKIGRTFAPRKNQWWIHLRARIRASHARHRGSNPLSTTKRSKKVSSNRHLLFLLAVAQVYLQTSANKNKVD